MYSSKQSLGEVLSKMTALESLEKENKAQQFPESLYLLLVLVHDENQWA